MKVQKCMEKEVMDFSCQIVRLYRVLVFEEKEFVISKRLLKCGTAAGAFYADGKFEEAYRKLMETEFWLQMLIQFGFNADGSPCKNLSQLCLLAQKLAYKLEENHLMTM